MNQYTHIESLNTLEKHQQLIAALFGPLNAKSLDLAHKLLQQFGGLSGLSHADEAALLRIKGMTKQRVHRLKIAFKLGRCTLSSGIDSPVITKPEEAYRQLAPVLSGLMYEELHALYLNRSKHVLLHRRVSSGSSHMTVVDPKQILYHAITLRASGIILAHNHPSGNPTPSPQDLQVTKRLTAAAQIMGISILDHLVIGGGTYVSMAELGVFPESTAPSLSLGDR